MTVETNNSKFIFKVETTGQLKAEEVVLKALEKLKSKLNDLSNELKEIEQ